MIQTFDRFLTLLDRLMEAACHLLLVVIVSTTVMQVFLRFVVRSPTSWSEELALLLLIWFGMIAIAIAVRRHGHIAITILRDLSPRPVAVGLDLMTQVLILVFAAMLLLRSFDLMGLVGAQMMPALGISRAWLYYPVTVSGALMTLNAIGNIVTWRLAPGDIDGMS